MQQQKLRFSLMKILGLVVVGFANFNLAYAQKPKNAFENLAIDSQVVAGEWKIDDGELQVNDTPGARIVLFQDAPEDYALSLEFTRVEGENSVGVILPVGSSQCAFILSAFKGEAHGIGVVDGKLAKANSTTIKPGKLKSGHPYRLLIEVKVDGDTATIDSTLDGRPFLNWKGAHRSLSMLDFWKLPNTKNVGLVTYAKTTFHSVTLGRLDPTMRMTGKQPAVANENIPTRKAIEFEGKKWLAPNAESIEIESFDGKRALHIQGGENNFVPLSGVEFGDGTIEVDIASNTFSGVGFRGNGGVVEKFYVRPFNSGTAKHKNTVQYSLLGIPKFGWKALRDDAPGKYESGAKVEVNKWFHLRIVLRGDRMTAFVNDEPEPVLVVDKLLGEQKTGSIGVWGWDSYFANFRYTPAK